MYLYRLQSLLPFGPILAAKKGRHAVTRVWDAPEKNPEGLGFRVFVASWYTSRIAGAMLI